MNKTLLAVSPLILGLSLSPMAQAEQTGSGLSYDYAELRFVDTEINDVDGDGFLIGGSYKFDQNLVVVASYADIGYDFNIDATQLKIGVGYTHPFQKNFDLVGYGNIIRQEIDGLFGDDDETGFELSGGVRGLIVDRLEGRASVHYIDVYDSDTFISLGADYWIQSNISAGVTLDVGGDADTLTIGARWYYNNK